MNVSPFRPLRHRISRTLHCPLQYALHSIVSRDCSFLWVRFYVCESKATSCFTAVHGRVVALGAAHLGVLTQLGVRQFRRPQDGIEECGRFRLVGDGVDW